MRAWQPILTPKWAIITFFAFGIVFVPLGVWFYITSQNVLLQWYAARRVWLTCMSQVVYVEKRYDDQCAMYSRCNVTFSSTRQMNPPVYFYYQLENYFQNHRRYVASRSDDQLRGFVISNSAVCAPADSIPSGAPYNQNTSLILNPCGLIAQSMFNGTVLSASVLSLPKS